MLYIMKDGIKMYLVFISCCFLTVLPSCDCWRRPEQETVTTWKNVKNPFNGGTSRIYFHPDVSKSVWRFWRYFDMNSGFRHGRVFLFPFRGKTLRSVNVRLICERHKLELRSERRFLASEQRYRTLPRHRCTIWTFLLCSQMIIITSMNSVTCCCWGQRLWGQSSF